MADLESMSEAGRAAWLRARSRAQVARRDGAGAILRTENEDDDGYDPYPDYMDALSRSASEPLEEDPWR